MINYITLGTKDIEASAQFYEKFLEDFGANKRLVNMAVDNRSTDAQKVMVCSD